jgi:exopolysaccharide biosynthesis polyprenyl glycosylphosphotransferase
VSQSRRRLLLALFRTADLTVMVLAFSAAFVISSRAGDLDSLKGFLALRVKLSNFLLFAGFAGAWHLIFRFNGLYRSRRMGSKRTEWGDVTKAVTLGSLALAGLALLFALSAVTREFMITFFLTALAGTLATRTTLRALLSRVRLRGRNLRNVIIVGCGNRGALLGDEIRARPELGYQILGYVDEVPPPVLTGSDQPETLLGSTDEIEDILRSQEVDEVMIALPLASKYAVISHIVSASEQTGIIVRIPADLFELRLARAQLDQLGPMPVMTLTTPMPSAGGLLIKRGFDAIVSAIGMVVLMPAFAVISIAIRLDSRGPVFFRQDRVGLRQRRIRMMKFRTMVHGAEKRQGALEARNEVLGAAFKIKDDPRVTRVGRFLRKFSLDELPQLWNVLRGDMSLVGPRPLPVRDVNRLDKLSQRRRFSVQPGLTCLWQVQGRHELSFDDWMRLDLQYIDNWSLGLDLRIMLRTLPAVLRATGAS